MFKRFIKSALSRLLAVFIILALMPLIVLCAFAAAVGDIKVTKHG